MSPHNGCTKVRTTVHKGTYDGVLSGPVYVVGTGEQSKRAVVRPLSKRGTI